MPKKFLVTLSGPDDAAAVKESGCEVLAEYPDTVLVHCEDEEQEEELHSTGLETVEAPTPPVRVLGLSFAMADAVSTEASMPPADPSRPNYYVAQLVGPAKGEWLKQLSALGAEVVGSLPGEALLLRCLPEKIDAVRDEPSIESVASYRPAMKVSPKLRRDRQATLASAELAMAPEAVVGEKPQLVEVTVFPGEKIEDVSAKIQAAGGRIISQSGQGIRAIANQDAIREAANDLSVEAIQPFAFPETHNDVARQIMNVPANGAFGAGTLEGTGQIVAVADTGLDTGDMNNVHPDFQGRIDDITSFGTSFAPSAANFINGPLNTDDGANDTSSGHGTHVAGSVLGDGAAAIASSAGSVPRGTAPQARLYFQAIEQEVDFKSVNQLIQEGIQVPQDWPPPRFGLWGIPDDLAQLFDPAYDAGARIHTNSWGAALFGVYNENSRDVDRFMWEHRDMLIVYSAGNSGVDGNADAQIDADSIGAPGTAKNCLTVGASENERPNGSIPAPGLNMTWPQFNFNDFSQMGSAGRLSDNPQGMACFSSRGPTDDGRIKPDVVAPGTNVLSTRSSLVGANPLWGDVSPASDPLNGDYCWSGGTSMSTPLVAGLAACVREHLVTQRNHFQDGVRPSGALIKAFIVNGAQSISGQFNGEVPNGLNGVSGFGRTDGVSTIEPGQLGIAAFDDDPDNAVETGQIRSYPVQAADLNEPLKVTLCWTDRHSPGSGGLQNRLYLQVVDPNAAVVQGDVTPFPTVSNNVQQVTIDAPIQGNYTVRVRGVSVIQQAPGATPGVNPTQDFALVMSNGVGMNVAPVPSIAAGGIVNAASFAAGDASPGEILSIFGSDLGPAQPLGAQLDPNGNVTTQLGPTRVLFDGQPAPLTFVSASQVNVVAPFSLTPQAQTTIQVEVNGVQSAGVNMTLATVRPGVFSGSQGGSGQAAVLNQNASVNGSQNPAAVGSAIQIFATGGGQTIPAAVDGGLAPIPPPFHPLAASVRVEIDGIDAQVQFAGAAPQLVFGVVQVNAVVPTGVTPGNAVSLKVFIDNVPAQGGLTVAVS